jgi:hypothetical protein
VAALTAQGRDIATQLQALHNTSRSVHDRELIQEAATELRILLLIE